MPSKKKPIVGMPWDFASLMNEAIRSLPERPLQKRSHIWASELGGSYIDRYLKMWAHPYSNPFNDRMKRKMISSQVFEWIVHLMLKMCGVLQQHELRSELQIKGCLNVTGRCDFYAGGTIDWEKTKQEMERIQYLFAVPMGDMPPFIKHSIERILFRMEQMFTRVPLMQMILECKAVAGPVFDMIEKSNRPRQKHPLQTLHYLLANKKDLGLLTGGLLYINKDAFMCKQFDIEADKPILKLYNDDVKTMTGYYNASGKNYMKNLPPKSEELKFEEATFRFVKNNEVEYSPYLTMLYGYKDIEDFQNKWSTSINSWNRVFRRCVTGANMTALNKEVIEDVKIHFPLFDKYVAKAKAEGAFDKPEVEEEEK